MRVVGTGGACLGLLCLSSERVRPWVGARWTGGRWPGGQLVRWSDVEVEGVRWVRWAGGQVGRWTGG